MDVSKWLRDKKSDAVDKLFASPAVCRSVIRSLDSVSQQIVFRLVCTPEGTSAPEGTSSSAISTLTQSRVMSEHTHSLHPTFRSTLIELLSTDQPPPSIPVTSTDDISTNSDPSWDSIPCALLNLDGGDIPHGAYEVLDNAGILSDPARFTFLLKDAPGQAGELLCSALETIGDEGPEILRVLVEIAALSGNNRCDISKLPTTCARFLRLWRDVGLLSGGKSLLVGPTPLLRSVLLEPTTKSSPTGQNDQTIIVVETNFRVFAYTVSQLSTALISLFTELQYRLPNQVIAKITRSSIRVALVAGLTAEQIISYLQRHSKRGTTVPQTIIDQIRFWYAERERVVVNEAVVFSGWKNNDEFLTVKYACENELDIPILWSGVEPCKLVIPAIHEEKLRQFCTEKNIQ